VSGFSYKKKENRRQMSEDGLKKDAGKLGCREAVKAILPSTFGVLWRFLTMNYELSAMSFIT